MCGRIALVKKVPLPTTARVAAQAEHAAGRVDQVEFERDARARRQRRGQLVVVEAVLGIGAQQARRLATSAG